MIVAFPECVRSGRRNPSKAADKALPRQHDYRQLPADDVKVCDADFSDLCRTAAFRRGPKRLVLARS